jgi:nucleoside-diphosphate-sugar epimerase
MHVIVGAGAAGTATAAFLAEQGKRVRVITRGGVPPAGLGGIEVVAADARDAARLRELTAGAAVLYNCLNPPYHRWAQEWPPLAASILAAAEAGGAVLVTMSNLYAYGPVDVPMTEASPLRPTAVKGRVRAQMWQDALAAHRAGRVRVTEARASDYLGAGVKSMLTTQVLPKVVAGQPAIVPANLDAAHSWTYIGDVAKTLAVLGEDERAWGRPWHVPTGPAVTIREVARRAAVQAGVAAPRLSRMPAAVLWMGSLFNPQARGFREMAYQFDRPFVLDASAATTTFGIEPTPLDDALRETVAAIRVSIRRR